MVGRRWVRWVVAAVTAVGLAIALAGCAPPPGTFTVTTTVDGIDANPGDGVCEMHAGVGDCSLRAAIGELNAGSTPGDITIPSGTYALTLTGVDNTNAGGDLDVTSTHRVFIHAPQPGARIDAGGRDRALDVFGPDVTVLGVTATGATGPGIQARPASNLVTAAAASVGNAGAGIVVDAGAHLDLRNATLSGNAGGGVVNAGTTAASFTTVTANGTGGILGAGATTVTASIVAGQTSGADCATAPTSAGGNLASDASCALAGPGDVNSTAAGLGPLTAALLPVHPPTLGSAAVDAIATGSGACAGPPGDEHGTARPVGGGCDRGALEADFAVALTVNTAADAHDTNPGDGICTTVAGPCSLRAAIDETNARPATTGHTITLAADPTLTLTGGGEDANATGDLDLTTPVTLHGAGHTINANGLDRVIDVQPTARRLAVDAVTITGGNVLDVGGGIRDASGGLLVDRATIQNNNALGGGGVYETGARVEVRRSTITANTGKLGGGGVYAEHEGVIDTSTITANVANMDDRFDRYFAGGVAMGSGTITASTLGFDNGTSTLTRATSAPGTITVTASVISFANWGSACDLRHTTGGSVVSGGYNVVSDSTCAFSEPTDRQGVPVLLGSLVDNGGPTRTQLVAANGAAIDRVPAGTPGVCDGTTTDQRGVARPVGAGCDAGATEGAGPASPGLDLTVTTPLDLPDTNPGDGTCATSAGLCSLRAAISETNTTLAADTVTIAPGINPTLSIAGFGEDLNATGDLDSYGYLTIHGNEGTLDAASLDRALDTAYGTTAIDHLTITGGFARGSRIVMAGYTSAGGGVQSNDGDLQLDHVTLRANRTVTSTTSAGGGVAASEGLFTITDSTVDSNVSDDGTGVWSGGTITRIVRSTISRNVAPNGGSGATIGSNFFQYDYMQLAITSSTISGNRGSTGFLIITHGGPATVSATTIADNFVSSTLNVYNLVLTSSILRIPYSSGCAYQQPLSGGGNVVSSTGCQLSGPGDLEGVPVLLGPLAANGGPTLTHLPAANSVAVDHIPSGTPGRCDGSGPSDQRGSPRPIGSGCDAGAVEGTGPAVTPLAMLVDRAADAHDTNPGDGVCDIGDGHCSLRAAIDESNASQTIDTITIAPGINPVRTLFAGGDDNNQAGDLDITDHVTIIGNGAVLDAGGNDRVLDIHNSTVTISGITATNGFAFLTDFVQGYGGGIRSSGQLTLSDSTITNNTTSTPNGYGGGIAATGGTLDLSRVTVSGNHATSTSPMTPAGGGGVFLGNGTSSTIADSAITGNQTNQEGGGIDARGVSLTVRNTTISGNVSGLKGSAVNVKRHTLTTAASFTASTVVGSSSAPGLAVLAFDDGVPGSIPTPALALTATVLESPGANQCQGSVLPASGGWNIADDTTCGLTGTGDLQGNAIALGALGAHGGPTATQVPGSGHPALDRIPIGTADLCDGTLPTDQRGAARPHGTACDSGAVEV